VLEDARGELQGLEAVIDKDFASSLLARDLRAELLAISTGVEKVAIDFGTPNARLLDRMTVAEAKGYLSQGQFPRGSMGPKIEAVLSFLDSGGERALITNPPNLGRALRYETGTHIGSAVS
jgi:carbamate kinase